MDVILMQNVDGLGEMGATVTVARGYARNYLVPQGLAVAATDGARNVVAGHMKQEAKKDLARKGAAEVLAGSIGSLECTITVQADEEEKLFGSVTARDIAEAIETDKVELDHRMIALEEPIKQLGEYTVPVKLHAEVAVDAKVRVVKAE